MIYEHDCDTKLPNNLYDDEFHPGMKVLPKSRPNTDATPISYMIAKARLCNELGNILQATTMVGRHVPYDEIIRFDAKLRQVMQELAPHLKLCSLEGSHEPVTLLIARFNVDVLYQKILCLLHRKYITRARQNPRYAHSRRSAIEASLQAMTHLQTLHRESQGNGRLRSVSWYVKSVATREFTLPAMLIVLDLHYDNMAAQSGAPQDHDGAFLWSPEERSKMIGALEDATMIWKSLVDSSMEAFKASKVIEIMLEKIKDPAQSVNGSMPLRTDSISTLGSNFGMDQAPGMGAGTGMMSADGFGNFDLGMSPFSNNNSSAFMGMEFSLPPANMGDMQTDGYNATGAASPLSMFTNLGGNSGTAAEMTAANFDWVSIALFHSPVHELTTPCRALLKTTRKWRIGERTRASRSMEQEISLPNKNLAKG